MLRTESEKVCDIIICAEDVVRDVMSITNDSRTGIYICVARSSGRILTIALIGDITNDERAQESISFCKEKALRLSRYPEHVSSWQSRITDHHQQYGGAIRAGDYILSSYGFSEALDEIIMLKTARAVRLNITYEQCLRISCISNNPHKDLLSKE